MKHENPPYYSSELMRFCTAFNTSIRGGLDKILKYYINEHRPDDIITYVDKEWSNGKNFERIGFKNVGSTPALTFSIENGKRKLHNNAGKEEVLVSNQGNIKLQLKTSTVLSNF
ncbi:MAG: hypothetical protein MK078_07415 [Crocinitomicaceae bacterium]|nr:hypothetical protein [Crocinitomicaceae bacterium]